MKRIIIHWTGGAATPNTIEREHYHFMIDATGKVHCGKYRPEDNLVCKQGKYAAHTGGGNTGSIGVALCGMLGYKSKSFIGKYPLNKKQCEAAFCFVASLAKKYNLNVSKETILTHYEFGRTHQKTTSAGKPDITFLPPYPEVEAVSVGDFIRNKIAWYAKNLNIEVV